MFLSLEMSRNLITRSASKSIRERAARSGMISTDELAKAMRTILLRDGTKPGRKIQRLTDPFAGAVELYLRDGVDSNNPQQAKGHWLARDDGDVSLVRLIISYMDGTFKCLRQDLHDQQCGDLEYMGDAWTLEMTDDGGGSPWLEHEHDDATEADYCIHRTRRL